MIHPMKSLVTCPILEDMHGNMTTKITREGRNTTIDILPVRN